MSVRNTTVAVFLPALALFFSAGMAHAATPREELKQLVAQLQTNPADTVLRERIIKLAQQIKPAPVISEEAERRMARGEAAFESAKNVSDYENAIREFQAAANVSPWYSRAYFNLGVAQEKAGKAKEAMENFRFYLLAAPAASDAADVKKRIYKLEYAAEQVAKATVAPRSPLEKFRGKWKRVDGSRFGNFEIKGVGDDWVIREIFISDTTDHKVEEVTGDRLVFVARWQYGSTTYRLTLVGPDSGQIYFRQYCPRNACDFAESTYEVVRSSQ